MEEKILLNATVCLPIKNCKVLLGMKMKKIGAGRRNGYGGGIEGGETPKQSAIRELEEESGKKADRKFITVAPENIEKVAIVYFHNTNSDGTTFICKVHFFIAKDWIGEASETDEMTDPLLFDVDDLPYDQMMPADRLYFPLILNGKKIIAKAFYGPHQNELLDEVTIEEVDSLPED